MRNGLDRQLGLFPATNIVIANMIGAGIFTTTGLLMSNLGNPVLMLILWLIGGFIALMGALSYGRLGKAIPEAGGEYIFLSRLYSPMLGFLSGWVSFIAGFSTAIAASAIGFSEYIINAVSYDSQPLYSEVISPEYARKAMALLVVILFTFVHARGVKTGTHIQNILTVLKVVLLTGLIIIGLIGGAGNISHFVSAESFTFSFDGFKSIGLSLMWIMFAYSGWNAATYIGAEIKKPGKNIPRSLTLGTGIVTILYILLNLFFVYSTHPDQLEGVISIGGLTASNAFGPVAEKVVSLLIAFALFSSLSAFIIIGPRVYYAMARDGYFFKFAAKIHPRYNVPHLAIWIQAAIAAIMILTGTFDQILTYLGFCLSIFTILTVFSVYKLGRWQQNNTCSFIANVVPLLYILPSLAILVLAYFERPLESSIAVLTVLLGVAIYFLLKKRNAFIKQTK
ncbi:MAG: amino acid permease [Bacteroidetes bacterium]|jgi:APA family basic amino acid/polyamine antiporter|nr:amino acid permease [Bacteroidota bacterium]